MSKKLLNLLLVVVMLAVLMPTVLAAPPAQEGQDYVVVADDWLSKLADKYLGNPMAYPAIVHYTNQKHAEDASYAEITDPDLIEIGWKVYIPSAEEAAAAVVEAPAAKRGGTLVYGQISDANTLEPYMATGLTALYPMSQMFERLVLIDHDGSLKPWLAESWEGSEDAQTWTFHLRKDVKFHDGTPFNAEVVKFSYDRLMDPEHSRVAAQFQEGIKEVEVVDDYTVKFHLNFPNASFIYQLLGDFRSVMISPAAVEKYGEDLSLNPVGTGPFKFVEWRRDEQIVMERNEDYWDDPPLLDRIIWKVVPDEQTMLIELEKGTIHMTFNFPTQHLEDLRANPDIDVRQGLFHAIYGAWFNVNMPPFDDVRLRKALTLAVDVDTIVETIGADIMVKACGPVPTNNALVDPCEMEWLGYDPEEAKRILAELGWEPGPGGILQKDGEPLEIYLMWTEVVTAKDKELGEALQSYLSQIGADVRFEVLEWSTFSAARRDAKFDMCWQQTGPRPPDPGLTALDLALKCGAVLNLSTYCNKDYDAIVNKAMSTTDPAERLKYYKQAQEFIRDEYVGIYMGNPYQYMAIRKEVKNFTFSANRSWNVFNKTYLEE